MTKTSLVVAITGTFEGVVWKDFMIMAQNTEVAYDLVADFMAKGLVLHEVKIEQQGQWTDLPVELFTDQSLEQRTQPIQQEWQTILAPLSRPAQLRWERKAFLRRQLCFYQQQIERTHQRITELQETRQKPIRFHDPSLHERHLRQVEERLTSQQAVLSHLQEASQWTIDYLNTLEV